jgi:twitching motility protein PilT
MAENKRVQGDLGSFSIFDITQSLLSGRKTAYVAVESGHRRGYLSFHDGQIVHAVDDQLNAGEKAVFAIFSWRRGTFTIDFDVPPQEKNIKSTTDFLLLEVARHFDEASHDAETDGETDDEVESSVEERLAASLKSKLTKIFQRVAARAEPARDRYTPQAFDSLLGPLLELRGSALFLRKGLQPRVKGPDGFVTLKDAIIEDDEVNGFLMAILSEREAATLREQKEVSTLYDGGNLGAFRVGVFEEEGAATILITPARREIPALLSFGLDAAAVEVGRITEGLILATGPLGSGKTSILASLVAYHAHQRDKFAVVYSSEQLYAFPAERGFIMQRGRPLGGLEFGKAVGSALEQGADVLAVDPVGDADDLRLLLEVAGTGRLVIAAMQTLSLGETFSRLQKMTEEAVGDRIGRLLADLLRAVVVLPIRVPNQNAMAEALIVGREEKALLRQRDFGSLRLHLAVSRT